MRYSFHSFGNPDPRAFCSTHPLKMGQQRALREALSAWRALLQARGVRDPALSMRHQSIVMITCMDCHMGRH
jgi:hypothetical protein